MTHYRIYLTDPNGKVVAGYDHECASDEAAYRRAETLLGKNGNAEVWQATRRLGSVSRPGAALSPERHPAVPARHSVPLSENEGRWVS